MSALSDLGTFLKGEREGVTLELDNKLNAIVPYSGYLAVSKKLDNFYFRTSSSFIASMADKNRYVKFLDKVVDTWSDVIQTTSTQTANATATTLTMSNTTGLTVGKVIAILKGDLLVHTSVITAVSTNVSITILNSFNREATAYKIKTIQSINLNDYIPDVLVQDEATNGLTLQSSVNAGDYVVVDRIVQTGAELYRAKIAAPIGTLLTNTTYFEVRDSIGVTNQIGVFHKYNLLTNSYEGLSAEILFSDVSKEDLLDNPTWLARNGFSKAGEYCYSKGTYLYLPVSIWQTLNKGAYHPVFNGFGTKALQTNISNDAWVWYGDVSKKLESLADSYLYATINSIVGGGSGTILSNDIHAGNQAYDSSQWTNTRPDSKYYDIVYSDQVIDVREYAKVLNKWEVDLIRADKEENGVEEIVGTYTSSLRSNTNYAYVYNDTTFEVYANNSTKSNFEIGDKITAYFNGATSFIMEGVVSAIVPDDSFGANAIYLTKATVTAGLRTNGYYTSVVMFKKTIPILSSNTKLSTDLICNPTNYPQIIKDRLAEGKGIVGVNPLLVDDLGNNLIPDGVKDSFKLKDKFTSILQSLRSTNNGSTYTAFTATNSTITNALTLTNEPTANIVLVSMTAKNNPYTQTTPKSVVEVLPKVKASNSNSIYKGALVGNQISGKIQVGNGSNGYESKVLEYIMNPATITSEIYLGKTSVTFTTNNYYLLTDDKFTYANKGEIYKWKGSNTTVTVADFTFNDSTYWDFAGYVTIPTHSTIALDNSNSPASKWFEVLEEGDNGVLAGVYGKELVWDYSVDREEEFTLIASTDTDITVTSIGNKFRVVNTTNSSSYTIESVIQSGTTRLRYLQPSNGYWIADDGTKWFKDWDGNGFGDNELFDQLTNGTKTDLNGRTIRTFHGSLPINAHIK